MIVQNVETRPHLCANDVNSGPFSIYGNRTPQTLLLWLNYSLNALSEKYTLHHILAS